MRLGLQWVLLCIDEFSPSAPFSYRLLSTTSLLFPAGVAVQYTPSDQSMSGFPNSVATLEIRPKVTDVIPDSPPVPRFPAQPAHRPPVRDPSVSISRPRPGTVPLAPRVEHFPIDISASGPDPGRPFNMVFGTRTFNCERMSSRRLCVSSAENACLLIAHSGRIPDFVDVRKYVSNSAGLSSRDLDRVHALCVGRSIYESEVEK